jgi:hypothetical protein
MTREVQRIAKNLHEKAGHLEAFMPATAQDFHELADEVAALEAAPKPLAVKTGTMVYNGANYGWGVYVSSVHEDLELDINHQHKVRIIILKEAGRFV